MNDFPTVCHASYFSPVTQGKLRFLQHKHTGRCYLVCACLLFSGRKVVISCFSYPVSSSTATAAGWQQGCHQPPNVNIVVVYLHSKRPHCSPPVRSETVPSSFWNPSLPTGTHSRPTFSSSDGRLFCQYRQCEMGRLNIRKLKSDTVLILTVLLILKYALLLLNRLFLWHIYLFIFSSIFLCIHSIIYKYK